MLGNYSAILANDQKMLRIVSASLEGGCTDADADAAAAAAAAAVSYFYACTIQTLADVNTQH